MRDEFEQWIRDRFKTNNQYRYETFRVLSNGDYFLPHIQMAWLAWQTQQIEIDYLTAQLKEKK